MRSTFHHSLDNTDIESVWVIKGGRMIDIDISALDPEADTRRAKEYQLSELGRYLVNPNPIEVKKRLVGGEIHYRKGLFHKLSAPFRSSPKNGGSVAEK